MYIMYASFHPHILTRPCQLRMRACSCLCVSVDVPFVCFGVLVRACVRTCVRWHRYTMGADEGDDAGGKGSAGRGLVRVSPILVLLLLRA